MTPKIYTIGYQGRRFMEFVTTLRAHDIRTVVDIRGGPVSARVSTFHDAVLPSALARATVNYIPMHELGIPHGEYSETADDHSCAEVFKSYRSKLKRSKRGVVKALVGVVVESPTALMCVERNAATCPRCILAEVLAETTGLEVVHLQ